MNNFIGGWFIEDKTICDDLIKGFETSDYKYPGITLKGVDKTVKHSTDVNVDNLNCQDAVKKYSYELQKVLTKYIDKYKFCNDCYPFSIYCAQVQHYKPTEGYFVWHSERDGSNSIVNNRYLVFMTYLNDVNDGGETEFYYQKLKVKPRKG